MVSPTLVTKLSENSINNSRLSALTENKHQQEEEEADEEQFAQVQPELLPEVLNADNTTINISNY